MHPLRFLLSLALALVTLPAAFAQDDLVRREWTVDGVKREALIHLPDQAKSSATPVIFAFHGHGGSMNQAAKSFGYHRVWPAAIVVYPQGLNNAGRLTDPEGKRPGWQMDAGDQADRDIKFFDAMLASLRQDYRLDDQRLYAAGHSNGGSFTYLLWAMRGDQFAAFAPSGSLLARDFAKLKPKPVFHTAGENDPLVKFTWQKAMIDKLKILNQCGEGQPAGESITLYPSKINAPIYTFITSGGHTFPAEAPAAIVKFFQSQKK
jgi:polyhydroxybutyrate depolymerase